MSFSPVKEANGELVGFAAITREVSDAGSQPGSKNGR